MDFKKIFIVFLLSLCFFVPGKTKAADYNSCCICQSVSQFGGNGLVSYFLPSGSTADNPITNGVECDAKSVIGVQCYVTAHELCGEIKIETNKLQDFKFGNVILGVTIPNLRFSAPPTEVDEQGNIYIPWIGEYVKALYSFSMVIISIIAVVVIIVQGLRISASAGGPAKKEATQKISQTIIGLLIAWGSYIILFAINPNLTTFRSLDIRFIDRVPNIDLLEDEPLATVPDRAVNNVPDYKQFDKRWGGEMFGYLSRTCDCGTKSNPGPDRSECSKVSEVCCTNIKASGCGATSLAMILSAYGSDVTPLETAEYIGMRGNGRVCNKGVEFNTVIESLSESPWSSFVGKEVSQDDAFEILKKGNPIVFLCKNCTGNSKTGTKSYSGHYMVLTGISKGNKTDEDYTVNVNDPGGNANSGIITMTKTQLLDNNGFWYVYQN